MHYVAVVCNLYTLDFNPPRQPNQGKKTRD